MRGDLIFCAHFCSMGETNATRGNPLIHEVNLQTQLKGPQFLLMKINEQFSTDFTLHRAKLT